MSANASPVHFKDMEDAFITDAHFKVDISQKMKVPDKISFNTNINGAAPPGWTENINMQVPDRILVVGQDQHIGKTNLMRKKIRYLAIETLNILFKKQLNFLKVTSIPSS